MYPEPKLPADKRYLSAFAWFDYIRPKDKNDVFVWRSKDAKNILKKSQPKNVPLQTLGKLDRPGGGSTAK